MAVMSRNVEQAKTRGPPGHALSLGPMTASPTSPRTSQLLPRKTTRSRLSYPWWPERFVEGSCQTQGAETYNPVLATRRLGIRTTHPPVAALFWLARQDPSAAPTADPTRNWSVVGASLTLRFRNCLYRRGSRSEPTIPLATGHSNLPSNQRQFFAQHDLRRLFGGLPLDLGFIDGMHRFEFALRDFINFKRASDSRTVLLVHDCLPVDA